MGYDTNHAGHGLEDVGEDWGRSFQRTRMFGAPYTVLATACRARA